MRRTFIIWLFVFCALGGCRNKSVAEMSDEEKIALRVAGQEELSPSDQVRQEAARREILERNERNRAAEELLAKALARAESELTPEARDALRQNQDRWLRSGRGADMNALVAEGLASGDAFGESAKLRAEWIETRCAWHTAMAAGALFRSTQGQVLEAYPVGNRMQIVLRARRNGPRWITITAAGPWDGSAGTLASEIDSTIRLRVRADRGGYSVVPEKSDATVGAEFLPLFEGWYAPVEKVDVFAL